MKGILLVYIFSFTLLSVESTLFFFNNFITTPPDVSNTSSRLTRAFVESRQHSFEVVEWYPNSQQTTPPNNSYRRAEGTIKNIKENLEKKGIVYVETDVPASYSLLEAEWVAHLASMDKRIQGLVANAPVEDGEGVRVYLDTLIKIGKRGEDGHTLLKGVRRIIQHESPEFCLQPSFVAGVKLLSQYNLSFDICCKPQHLANVIELVADCPDTHFVLDQNDAGFEAWSDNISKLAKLPNIYCKLSGIVTEAETATGGKWKPEVLHKYVAHILQAFGSLRVMFGSDWPVLKLGQVGYVDWLGIHYLGRGQVSSLMNCGYCNYSHDVLDKGRERTTVGWQRQEIL